MKQNWKFLVIGRFKLKKREKTFLEEVWIFSGNTHCDNTLFVARPATKNVLSQVTVNFKIHTDKFKNFS